MTRRLPTGCPSPAEDLPGFLAWHRQQFGGSTMTAPTGEPGPNTPATVTVTTGGGSSGGSPTPTPTPGPPASPPPSGDRVFTQDEVNRMMAREKDQGERAGRRALLQSLGVSDPDNAKPEEIKALLDAEQARRREQESEAERKLREASERDQAAAAREARALEREKRAVLTTAGLVLPTEPEPRQAALDAAARLLDIQPDDDDAVVQGKVDALKQQFPGLFGSAGSTTPPAPSGGPTGTPPRQTPAGDAYERGAARAKARLGSGAKT